MPNEELLERAKGNKEKAYAPYSKFHVGAALLCENGRVYDGANIENAALSPGVCAERAAFAAAIVNGERRFTAIAVAGGDNGQACFPCGVCRQFMSEFAYEGFDVIVEENGGAAVYPLKDLLPKAFTGWE